jgi:hypothetical protein
MTALLALFSVLFMQLAVAAYACPTLSSAQAQAFAAAAEDKAHDGMVGCEGTVDIEQPSLCYAHSQYGTQSLDKPVSPNLPPAIAFIVIPDLKLPDTAYWAIAARADTSWLRRDSETPLSIRNCCFRI